MFNMDTLLTLGSLAAYVMSIFMLIVYTIESENESTDKDD